MTLKQVKTLIVQSKFSEALELLEEFEKQQSSNALNSLEIISLRTIILRRTRNNPLLRTYAKKLTTLFEKVKTEYFEIIEICNVFTSFLNKKESLDTLIVLIDELPHFIQEKIPLLLYRQIGVLYVDRRAYDYPVYYDDLKQLKIIFKDFNDQIFYLEILVNIIWTNLYRWENKIALKLANEYLKINEDINDHYGITFSFGTLAAIYADMGNCKEAIYYSLKYLKHAEKLGVLNIIWHACFAIALHYAYAADINKALKFDARCSELEKHPDFTDIFTTPTRKLITIHITWKKGDVDLALNQMLELLERYESHYEPFSLAMAYGVLADIYYQKSNLEIAASYFQKSLRIREEFGAYTILANNYFHLLEINLQQGMKEIAMEYFDKIRKMKEETDEIWVNQLHSLSKALILKSSKDDEIRNQAKKILTDLVSTETPFQVTANRAYLHLCDLILEEIKSTANMQLIEILHNYINELTLKATYAQSNLLIIELHFLQSKILLLDLKVEEALNVLNQAQELAREKGITRLELLLSNEYDVLLEQLDKWEDLTTNLPSLEERFELTHIEDFLNGMIRKWISYSDVVQEEESPYFFVILDKEGSIVFSDSFSSESLDYSKISEIFSKINDFEAKNENYQFPVRFRYKELSCLLFKKQDFFFCYVFMGKSFQPIKKFALFLDEFLKSSISREFTESWLSDGNLTLDIRTQLSNLIEQSFEAQI